MAKKLADKLPALVRQPRGGALLSGGLPGHVGGGGRPSSALRERLRGSFQERVKVLEEIADDPKADPQDRIRAIDVLAKYGLGVTREMSVEEVRDRLRETVALICTGLPSHQATEILAQLRQVWTQ
jgi:hypothetical protein